jgi:hypothetical protein
LEARRAREVARATKKTSELGAAEKLQAILSKQRHAEAKREEMLKAKLGKVKAHNETVSIRKSASTDEL